MFVAPPQGTCQLVTECCKDFGCHILFLLCSLQFFVQHSHALFCRLFRFFCLLQYSQLYLDLFKPGWQIKREPSIEVNISLPNCAPLLSSPSYILQKEKRIAKFLTTLDLIRFLGEQGLEDSITFWAQQVRVRFEEVTLLTRGWPIEPGEHLLHDRIFMGKSLHSWPPDTFLVWSFDAFLVCGQRASRDNTTDGAFIGHCQEILLMI